ncbi:MAG: sugar-transfer associated ATP-grasp domain-containing protein [Acidobacteriota bacterium]|nr:sugar-transfer associated ATP-grasp domain-containing protein [Acidobacteriota bacterium]
MKRFKNYLIGKIRIALLGRGRKRSAIYINKYTKSLYPKFDFSLKVANEDKHIEKWKILQKKITPIYYRLYSTLSCNPDINFVPDDIYINIILPLLNKRVFNLAYSEKNSYDILHGFKVFPRCIVRNIDGIFLDLNYNLILIDDIELSNILKPYKKIVLKPSIDSSGGKNVNVFLNNGKEIFEKDNKNKLTMEYLNNYYKKDYVIQEYIEQHQYLSNFNPTSLNTLRIMTYRSVLDEKIRACFKVT